MPKPPKPQSLMPTIFGGETCLSREAPSEIHSQIPLAASRNRFSGLEAALDVLHRLNMYLCDEYALGSFTKRLSRNNLFELASLLPARSAWSEESFDATKNTIKKRFKIGSNELSDSIKLIESHFELASEIEVSIPLLGVEEIDVQEFFCHWFKQHNVPSDKDQIDIECSEWRSDFAFESIMKDSEIEAEVWGSVKSGITPEKLAGVSALFYFARELDFSESYINIYDIDLKEAQKAFADSEYSVRSKYFHLFDKTSAVHNILQSLYFLRKRDLADRLVATHGLGEKFSWLDDARSRVLFRKPDYCGCAI